MSSHQQHSETGKDKANIVSQSLIQVFRAKNLKKRCELILTPGA